MKLYQKIARVASQKNTIQKGEELKELQKYLPIVKGIEKSVILLKSTENRIVIDTAYWHELLQEWTDHQIVVTPSFEGEINVRVTGKNVENIKSHLNHIFREALLKEEKVLEMYKEGIEWRIFLKCLKDLGWQCDKTNRKTELN